MSARKSIGNRWATAVEGAADILLDAGKTKEEDHSVQSAEELPKTNVTPEPKPAEKEVKKAPVKVKSAGKNTTAQSKATKSSLASSIEPDKEIPPSDSSDKKVIIESSQSTKEIVPVLPQPQSIDPIQQAFTMKGTRSRGGRQRTYYIDNDIADKITSYAKELDKSESQFLRELLRAVFKMNEQ
jgi:hypothetical protein